MRELWTLFDGFRRERLEGITLTLSWPFPSLSCTCSPLAKPNQKQGSLWSSPYRSASGVEQIGGEMGVDPKGANEMHTAQTEKYLLELITRDNWGLWWNNFQGYTGPECRLWRINLGWNRIGEEDPLSRDSWGWVTEKLILGKVWQIWVKVEELYSWLYAEKYKVIDSK